MARKPAMIWLSFLRSQVIGLEMQRGFMDVILTLERRLFKAGSPLYNSWLDNLGNSFWLSVGCKAWSRGHILCIAALVLGIWLWFKFAASEAATAQVIIRFVLKTDGLPQCVPVAWEQNGLLGLDKLMEVCWGLRSSANSRSGLARW